MEDKTKKCCTKCKKAYYIKALNSVAIKNIPLFLSCGHSMCEICVKNYVTLSTPIECAVCHQHTEFSPENVQSVLGNRISLYSLFPVNVYTVGEITLQALQDINDNDNGHVHDYFINIEDLNTFEANKGACVQCGQRTSMMCEQCEFIVCEDCFTKSHNYVFFQSHQLRSIVRGNKLKNCMSHPNNRLEYYCKDCSKPVCMDCFMVSGACHGHFIVPIHDENEGLFTQLEEIMPKVDEMFLRLIDTAMDIGNALTKLSDANNSTVYSTLMGNIDANFSKLNSIIQQQKHDITQQVLRKKIAEIDSLKKAKDDVTEILLKAKALFNSVDSLERDKLQEENIASLLEEAKAIANAPWCLRHEAVQAAGVVIKEDVCTSLNDYIQLEGQENAEFRLINTEALIEANEEIPEVPTTVVCPSEYMGDLTQELNSILKRRRLRPLPFDETPEYSSRSSSSTSFNSNDSGSSHEAIQIRNRIHRLQLLSPLPETSDQEPINSGWRELMFISHIVDPNNFYVHRPDQRFQVQRLREEFSKCIFYDRPPEEYVTVGKILLVYNYEENFWQRSRIVSIDRIDANTTIYNVFCFDFGTTAAVEIESMRYVPPGRIESPSPQAIKCTLIDCEPIDGSWTNNDGLLMQKIIDDKPIVIYIKHVHYMPTGIMELECDISTYEDGISLTHALAFHGRARIPDHVPLTAAQMFAVWKKPKIIREDYRISIEDVVITHIACPEHFYVRKFNLQPEYEKLCEDMEQEYRYTIKTDLIYLPEKSMACVAHVQGYGLGTRWARGVVLELQENATVRVMLSDIGVIVELHWRDLRHIHKKFTVQLGYATECHLYGVTPRDNQWCQGSTELLESFQNKTLEMHVKDISNHSSLGIELYDKNDEENIISINDEMVKNKFAIYFGCNKNTDANKLVFAEESSLEKKKPKERVVRGPMKFKVNILNYESPSLMYVSFGYTQKVYSEFFEIINILCSNTKTQGKIDWKVGDKCCTFYNQSQTWRRAVILELENENAKVFYSDFGSVETVPVLNLREIYEKLARVSGAAVLCHLYGVVPAEGEEWPSLTKEFLKELLDKYNEFFVIRVGEFKGESLSIELWVKETLEEAASESNDWEWLSLNKQIIDKGLGIPDKQEIEKRKLSYHGGYEKQLFYKINPDTIPIAPMVIKALRIEFKELLSEASSAAGEIDTSNEEYETFKSDWSPPDPLPTNEFTAMPTHISHNGVIYLHDITQEDTLDLIRKALEVCFTNPDPEAKFAKWTVGEPCIALFSSDNRFYRGKVLIVDNNTSTCLIHYIDYGNEELVAFENLRKSIVLYQIPTLAHKCILNRIRPVNNNWNPKSLDYIHKSIIKKQCYVKVSGPPIGGLIPIEIKYNNIWINDHLVISDMALYADGSKAFVRKFAPSVKQTQKLEQSASAVFDPATPSVSSFYQRKSYNDNDWVQILGEEGRQSICDNSVTYSPSTKAKFTCYLNVLNEPENLELTIIHDAEAAKAYENMFKELQSEGKNMPALTSIYKNKACVVQFQGDNQWYRASILQYSENKKHLKVKYVDFGNVEIVCVADVKEISEKYTKLPPSTLTVTLHGVKINPDIEKNKLLEYYKGIFFDKVPFVAKVINGSKIIPSVELRNDEGQLIYESLIEQNILLKCD